MYSQACSVHLRVMHFLVHHRSCGLPFVVVGFTPHTSCALFQLTLARAQIVLQGMQSITHLEMGVTTAISCHHLFWRRAWDREPGFICSSAGTDRHQVLVEMQAKDILTNGCAWPLWEANRKVYAFNHHKRFEMAAHCHQ